MHLLTISKGKYLRHVFGKGTVDALGLLYFAKILGVTCMRDRRLRIWI